VNAPYDAVVVGAGPAGSAAATLLARRERRVLLVEKDRFPRPKVCGEFLSAAALPALERLRVRERLEALRPEHIVGGTLWPAGGRALDFQLQSPAIGVSRFRFDALLAERAREAGAELRPGTRVTAVEGSAAAGFRLRVSAGNGEQALCARAVIGAWGRWDALDRALRRRFLAQPRFFGWSRDYGGYSTDLCGSVRLYLFPGGYCGLSRVEEGGVNLAGVISEPARRRLPAGWEAVLLHARRQNARLDGDLSALEPGPVGFLGTVPVVFTSKAPVERGILLAGDAAGVIDPFSGEGQAAALDSGILAGETTERFLGGELSPETCAATYARAWRERFHRRFLWSALLRRLILDPRLGAAAARLAGEHLVRFGLGRLAV
jgi:flavin-dependent dehydrogenase